MKKNNLRTDWEVGLQQNFHSEPFCLSDKPFWECFWYLFPKYFTIFIVYSLLPTGVRGGSYPGMHFDKAKRTNLDSLIDFLQSDGSQLRSHLWIIYRFTSGADLWTVNETNRSWKLQDFKGLRPRNELRSLPSVWDFCLQLLFCVSEWKANCDSSQIVSSVVLFSQVPWSTSSFLLRSSSSHTRRWTSQRRSYPASHAPSPTSGGWATTPRYAGDDSQEVEES